MSENVYNSVGFPVPLLLFLVLCETHISDKPLSNKINYYHKTDKSQENRKYNSDKALNELAWSC